MAFKMKGSALKSIMDLKKKKGFGPRASKGSDDQSKELAVSKFEMGEYKNDPTGTYKLKAEVQDDKALDKAEDAKGVGQQKKSKKKKVMQDGPKTQVHGIKAPGNWQPHQFRKK